ncbi:hypothetical protein PV325_005246 [Microctonus aethiopoides]|uniref:Uncharacterized protein n=1 Tax=Microctonus aethiopoides TaxID=144406 RepID=A0AA39EZU8_9HYME|nr:hypothetical protein PV325_005246 [Microctonus aethiopoides]KAK0158956.1 hypothetical protein PV328_009890 [Microctonus aethiopoides]
MYSISIIILSIYLSGIFRPIIATNPLINTGNIISIVIPEGPNPNINIDQLTSDFRHQLERIKQQNNANKLDNHLITSTKVLPEISNDENKKILSVLRRAILKNKNQMQNIISSDANGRIVQRKNDIHYSRRNLPKWINSRKYYQHHDITSTTKRTIRPMKLHEIHNQKYPKVHFDQINNWNIFEKKSNDNIDSNNSNNEDNKMNNFNNWSKFSRELNRIKYPKNFNCNNNDGMCRKKLSHETIHQDDQLLKSIQSQNQSNVNKFWRKLNFDQQQEKLSMKYNNLNTLKKNMTINDCIPMIFIDVDNQIYSICNNTNLINIPENIKSDNNDFSNLRKNENIKMNNAEDDEEIILPINIEVDDFKGMEKIIENPQTILDRLNSSEFDNDNFRTGSNNNMLNRNDVQQSNDNLENAAILTSINQERNQFNDNDERNKNNKNIFEFTERVRDFTNNDDNNKQFGLMSDGMGNKHRIEDNIPSVTRELDFDNENFEIRIQRSIDDNFQLKKSINAQIQDLLIDINKIKLKPITNEQ